MRKHATHAQRSCDVCGDTFTQTNTRHRVCNKKECKTKRRSKYAYDWKVAHGQLSGKSKDNLWTEQDIEVLMVNRYASTKELAKMLGRTTEAVKEKRFRYSLPRLALCVKCGEEHQVINQHLTCLKCVPTQKEYAEKHRDSLNGRISMYMTNAKRRGLSFDLSMGEFASFWKKPCSYCGSEIKTIGLDRIDSSIGYNISNVVSCCSTCNAMKNNSSNEKWIAQMKKILTKLGEVSCV